MESMGVTPVMKKKILFMVISMNIGGVEKALLNMLKTMGSSQNEVTVLMLETD